MKAVLVTAPGPASNFYIGDVPIPQPKDNEVLIRITHSALNRADLMQVIKYISSQIFNREWAVTLSLLELHRSLDWNAWAI